MDLCSFPVVLVVWQSSYPSNSLSSERLHREGIAKRRYQDIVLSKWLDFSEHGRMDRCSLKGYQSITHWCEGRQNLVDGFRT